MTKTYKDRWFWCVYNAAKRRAKMFGINMGIYREGLFWVTRPKGWTTEKPYLTIAK